MYYAAVTGSKCPGSALHDIAGSNTHIFFSLAVYSFSISQQLMKGQVESFVRRTDV